MARTFLPQVEFLKWEVLSKHDPIENRKKTFAHLRKISVDCGCFLSFEVSKIRSFCGQYISGDQSV